MQREWSGRVFFLLFFIAAGIALGQSAETGSTANAKKNDVFAPFVSRLKAKESEYNVTLTWLDSDDVKGDNLIFRYTEPISEKNLFKATMVARVPYGTELYYDYPPDTHNYFYAVLIESPDTKQRYDLFIPFRNITSVGISITSAGSLEEIAARIKSIKVSSSIKGIDVTFTVDRANRTLVMYRSIYPIETRTDLEKAVSWPLAQGATSYLDLPPAGLDYYYAVLDSELAKRENVELVKGENTTRYPAKVPFFSSDFKAYESRTLRPHPLPLLTLQEELESGRKLDKSNFYLPPEKRIRPATEKIIARLIGSFKTNKDRSLAYTLLEIEQTESETEEDKTLKSIVQQCLIPGLQAKAIEQLNDFIKDKDKHTASVIRAHFYLGQAYYFDKQYQKALLELLMAQDEYYVETTPWINSCFDKLEK